MFDLGLGCFLGTFYVFWGCFLGFRMLLIILTYTWYGFPYVFPQLPFFCLSFYFIVTLMRNFLIFFQIETSVYSDSNVVS